MDNQYKYTSDLMSLDHNNAGPSYLPHPPQRAGPIPPISAWLPFLESHPDKSFSHYITKGLTTGFRVGFDPTLVTLRQSNRNHVSVRDNPQTVSDYLQLECQLGRLNGPFQPKQVPGVHCSPMGIIPKPHQPGKWRLIIDLSFPEGHSVNDGIPARLCSIEYASIDQAVQKIRNLGQGTLLAKLDLKSAYRMVPVHPEDQRLLGMFWENKVMVDTCLPFGLRSAPKIFSAVADGLTWAMHCKGIQHLLHYLDDFLFFGPPNHPKCSSDLTTAQSTCRELGFPIAEDKVEGPSTSIIFLGIEIDTIKFELRLPAHKLQRLQSLIDHWMRKKAASKRELQSIIGHLSHAATVVKPGRTFLRFLIEAAKIPRQPDHWVRLNSQCRSDIAWWSLFLEEWNGVSFMPSQHPSFTSTSDASGSWGCGAVSSDNQWFQLPWPAANANKNIAIKEMIPIVISAAVWGHLWKGKQVLFLSDNESVVSVLNTRAAKDKQLVHLSCCLFFFAAMHQFTFVSKHIAGKKNGAADALSRNQLNTFFSLIPQALPEPSFVPQALVKLLWEHPTEWTSPLWRQLFKNSIHAVLQNQQTEPTHQLKNVSSSSV